MVKQVQVKHLQLQEQLLIINIEVLFLDVFLFYSKKLDKDMNNR